MRVPLKSALGWVLPLACLALPNCSFEGSTPSTANVISGAVPRSTALMCDIPKPLSHRCASARDLALGIRMAGAAVALARNQKSTIGLDWSPEALAECDGRPRAVDFYCAYPEGCPVCLNCGVIGPSPLPYPDQDAVCADRCEDMFGDVASAGAFLPDVPPVPSVRDYCGQYAKASTNMVAVDPCVNFELVGACSTAGTVSPGQQDPRRRPSPVHWRDKIGVAVSGGGSNTLTRTALPTGAYDAGAASRLSVETGDGYVEFTAVATDAGRALGLTAGVASDASPDTVPTLEGIGHAVRVSPGGEVFVHQSGVQINGPNPPNGHWTTHAAGDRIRVGWIDNLDDPHTATVTYYRIPAACDGILCEGYAFYTGGIVAYPFRIDASLRQQGAALNAVNIVYVKSE